MTKTCSPSAVRAPLTRRRFVQVMGGAAAGAALGGPAPFAIARSARKKPLRKKVALIATEIRKHSHAQHFVDRLVEGFGWQGRHYFPQMELAGLYVDQFPEGDLTSDRVARHQLKLFPTVEEALTLGSSQLAVDGVLIIAEHGLYPRSGEGQTLYPRHAFFQRTVDVFKSSGRAVPVFNDKHLSTRWSECLGMVQASRDLGFEFLAGSSLPVTWRIPSVEIPLNTPLEESVCVAYGGIDSYDIHGLETAQCMSERRAGGEVGVKSVRALRGAAVWHELTERKRTQQLFLAALSRSFSFKGNETYPSAFPDLNWLRWHHKDPVAYFVEHLDGFQTSLFILNGLVSDFTYAGKVAGRDQIYSCQMYLPMPPVLTTTANFFSPLMHNIEKMVLENKAPYPVERTLLTSGITLFGVESLYRGKPVETPELKVQYQAAAESSFWRA